MIGIVRRTAVVVALVGTLAAAAPANTKPPFWRKTWTVSGVLGPPTAAEAAKEIVGQPVTLTAERAATPYSTPCAGAPDYRDIRIRPRKEMARHFGPFWKFPTALGPKPTFGWVRCPGAGNIGAFAFSDARHGYYFFEDGLIITLR